MSGVYVCVGAEREKDRKREDEIHEHMNLPLSTSA